MEIYECILSAVMAIAAYHCISFLHQKSTSQVLRRICSAEPSVSLTILEKCSDVVVQRLLNKVADNNLGQLLFQSAFLGHSRIAKVILPRIARESLVNAAFSTAVYNGHIDTVKVIMEYSSVKIDFNRLNAMRNSCLMTALMQGHIQMASVILQEPSVDINIENRLGERALQIACTKGLSFIVETLMNRPEVEPDANNNAAIQSCLHTHLNLAIYMLEKRAVVQIPKIVQLPLATKKAFQQRIDANMEACIQFMQIVVPLPRDIWSYIVALALGNTLIFTGSGRSNSQYLAMVVFQAK